MTNTTYDSDGLTLSPIPTRCRSIRISALFDVGRGIPVYVVATDYDHNNADNGGCDPDGCVAENTRDSSTSSNSRWSCQGDGCCITYLFNDPQDIVRMRNVFHKGDKRTRTLQVYDNGDYHSSITSGGMTSGYESFSLNTDGTEDLRMCLEDDGDDRLGITEVKILVT